MINNSNSQNKSNNELQASLDSLLGQKGQIGDDIKRLINSLSEEDVKKISGLMKNKDLQKIASSIIESKGKKE